MQFYNSLTKKLEEFDHDKELPVRWYSCGPTIYSSAHLGHARTFISFDIIRRVLIEEGYDVCYAMNITDIDDKIINKVKSMSNGECDTDTYMKFIIDMEKEFWFDMDSLGVMRPTIVTRVTEYIGKIIKYIVDMEKNGLTYIVNGTVYLNSQEYKSRGYNLDIFNRAVTTDYSECEFSSDKKDNADFALWKAAKHGEIKFDSKWGKGRPAWHIECSVMSYDIFGEVIDVHSGATDLIFPHHNNEIVQSIAHENTNYQPVKVFLHTGHLNINGDKMAKSLGNFITIRHFLENVGTARQLRIMCLQHNWNKPMDFTDETIDEAKRTEKRMIDFYANIDFLIRTGKNTGHDYSDNDMTYSAFLDESYKKINYNLKNNVDTRSVMDSLMLIITTTNIYTLDSSYNNTLLQKTIDYMSVILELFGLTSFKVKSDNGNADKFIDMLVDFREDMRSVIKKNIKDIPNHVVKELFDIMDDLRDNKLKLEGIVIEDLGKSKTNNKWKRM